MLITLFTRVFQLSVQGIILLLLVIVLRKMLYALGAPRILNTFLWCAVLFQLLCPLRIPLPLISYQPPAIENTIISATATISEGLSSLISSENVSTEVFIENDQHNITKSNTNNNKNSSLESSEHATTSAVNTSNATSPNHNRLLTLLSLLWFLGVLLLLFRGATQYHSLRKHIRLAYRTQEYHCIYYTGTGVSTPFILGILRPRIYLPSITNPIEKAYIYHHEQAHLKHGDFLLKPLFYLALSLHWYNPLVWLGMRQMAIDIEAACDETVLKHFDFEVKPLYCNSLLQFAHAPHYATMPLCFGEGDFTKRIKDILNYKKPTFWAICSGTLLVGILCLLCLLNPFAPNVQNTSADKYSTLYGNEIELDRTAESTISSTSLPTDVSTTEPTVTPTTTNPPTSEPTTSTLSNDTETKVSEQPEMPSTSALTNDNNINLMWPVPQYDYISHWTVANEHDGIDIVANAGTAIYAAAEGVVTASGYNAAGTGYGYSIIIDHGNGFKTLYAHGKSVAVEVGDSVSQGDLIMSVGTTGRSTGNHLHFEVFINDVSLPFPEEETFIFALTD